MDKNQKITVQFDVPENFAVAIRHTIEHEALAMTEEAADRHLHESLERQLLEC